MYPRFAGTDWVTPFGLAFVMAIAVTWYCARRNAKTIDIDPSHIDLIVPVTIFVGIVGAFLLARMVPMDPTGAGGAMSHGPRVRVFNLVGTGAFGLLVYSRIAGLPLPRLLDLFAVPVVAGFAVHRVGCFLAGCCWGDIAIAVEAGDLAAQVQTTSILQGLVGGVQFPPASLPFEQHLTLGLIGEDALASLPVYPVQLYESALLLVMVLILSRVPWRRVPAGTLVVLTVSSYALLRFFLEFLRADGQLVVGNLTMVQVQCVTLVPIILLLPRLRRRAAMHDA